MLYSLVFAIGAVQAFIFAFLLLTKKPKNRADKFLSAFFFIVALYFFNICSAAFYLWEKFPDIVFIISLVALSFGPLLYFYVISLIGKEITSKEIYSHLVPILSVYLLIFPYVFQSEDVKLIYFIDKFSKLPINISIGIFLQYLSAPIYFIWIIGILKRYKEELKNIYSSVDSSNLDWIRKLLYGAIIMWTIDILNVYALNYTNIEYPYIISFYIKVVFMSFIILIGYNGIKQGNVFTSHFLITPENNNKSKDSNYKLIPDKLAKQHADTVINYIQNEKIFLNNELRIQDISIKLDIPVHIISYVINDKLDQNFYDLINNFRIEEVKSRLINPKFENLTIVAIAYDCGFNSKATFNRLFKKYTGTTPTQYKNRSHH